MKRRLVLVAAAIGITAAAVPAAWADGNVSTGSAGTVQVGSTGSSPSAGATTPLGTATVALPADVAGSGGNTAKQSVATAQIGGGNSASRSAGTAQASATHGAPHATVDVHVVRVDAGASGTVAGDGQNTAGRSLG